MLEDKFARAIKMERVMYCSSGAVALSLQKRRRRRRTEIGIARENAGQHGRADRGQGGDARPGGDLDPQGPAHRGGAAPAGSEAVGAQRDQALCQGG